MSHPTAVETPAPPAFSGGVNIALKTPTHRFDAAVAFYRDVLGLPVLAADAASVSFRFGANRLWVDRCERLSQAEVWLELVTPDTKAAAARLAAAGVPRCDAVEPLPIDLDGFWIAAPGDVVHLVTSPESEPETLTPASPLSP